MNPSTTSSVASLGNIGRWAVAPLQIRSFTSIQMVHTHAPQQRGRWDEDEDEMKMKMKMEWKLPNQDAKRGTQEKRERANTNTTHLARNGQNPEKARKKKSEGRRTRNQTSGGGGGRKRLNQPKQSESSAYLGTRRTQPTWREENAETHEKGDPWGTS